MRQGRVFGYLTLGYVRVVRVQGRADRLLVVHIVSSAIQELRNIVSQADVVGVLVAFSTQVPLIPGDGATVAHLDSRNIAIFNGRPRGQVVGRPSSSSLAS